MDVKFIFKMIMKKQDKTIEGTKSDLADKEKELFREYKRRNEET